MRIILPLLSFCALATAAMGTVQWDPDPPGTPPPNETGSSIADGSYIGTVDVIPSGEDTNWIITVDAEHSPEGVAGRLIINDNDLSTAEESTLNTAASQHDNDNFAKTEGDATIDSVGTCGPYP